MNAAMIQWADALDSGNYTQGTGALTWINDKGNEEHCCLGVACDLYNKEHPEELSILDSESSFVGGRALRSYDDSRMDLPRKVADWLGVSHKDGKLKTDHGCEPLYLSHLNDKGTPFSVIAQFISSGLVETV